MPDDNPVLPIRLTEQILSDLPDLVRNREHIATIVAAAEDVQPASSIRAFSSRVAENAGVEASVAFDVLHILVNIRRMQRAREVESTRMLEILTASLDRYAGKEWKEEFFDCWKRASKEVAAAVESIHEEHPLFISDKAETLAYSYQNILTSQRIITDVRPVFDTGGRQIKVSLVLHQLLIEYYDGISPPKRISFTLDAADIAALRKACERAEGKAKSALEALSDLNPIELPETTQNRD